MIKKVVVFVAGAALVACGTSSLPYSEPPKQDDGVDAGGDAFAPIAFDAAVEAEAATTPVDNSPPVTAFIGAFHGTQGGEMNLTAKSDGTWTLSTWLCGGGGGGGGCTLGSWQVDGAGWKLQPTADAGTTFRWGAGGGAVTSVSVTIVNGVLHTVSSDGNSIDFKSTYRCYDSCDQGTFTSCDSPRQCF